MRPPLRFLTSALAFLATPLLASAQLTIAGRVTDLGGRGLTGSQVLIDGTTMPANPT